MAERKRRQLRVCVELTPAEAAAVVSCQVKWTSLSPSLLRAFDRVQLKLERAIAASAQR